MAQRDGAKRAIVFKLDLATQTLARIHRTLPESSVRLPAPMIPAPGTIAIPGAACTSHGVFFFQVGQNTGRFKQLLTGVGVFQVRHLYPAVRLKERITLAASLGLIGAGLDALNGRAISGQRSLPKVCNGLGISELGQRLRNKRGKGT